MVMLMIDPLLLDDPDAWFRRMNFNRPKIQFRWDSYFRSRQVSRTIFRILFNVFQKFTKLWVYSMEIKTKTMKLNAVYVGWNCMTQNAYKHTKKAHGNVPEKKLDPNSGSGGTW